MKRILTLLCTAFIICAAFAANPQKWFEIGHGQFRDGNFRSAISYFQDAGADFAAAGDSTGVRRCTRMEAMCLVGMHEYDKGIALLESVLQTGSGESSRLAASRDEAGTCDCLGDAFCGRKEWDKAAAQYEKAMAAAAQCPADSLEHSDSVAAARRSIKAGIACCRAGQDAHKARRYFDEGERLAAEALGENSPEMVAYLDAAALCLRSCGDTGGAIRLQMRLLDVVKARYGEKSLNYANALGNLAVFHSDKGEYDRSISLQTEALQLRREISGEKGPEYATALSNLAVAYTNSGNYEKALDLQAQALEIRGACREKDDAGYATSLGSLAVAYSELGNHAKAMELHSRALEIIGNINGPESPEYALTLGNLAVAYSNMGDLQKSLECQEKALQIRGRVYGVNHPEYATALGNLAVDWSEAGEYAKAAALQEQACEIRRQLYGEDNPEYARSLGNLAVDLSRMGRYDEAIALKTRSVAILERYYGPKHPAYVTGLRNLAIDYLHNKDPRASQLWHDYIVLTTGIIADNFKFLPARERMLYWEENSYYLSVMQGLFVFELQDDPQMLEAAYNSALFSKGLLLNTETQVSELIAESGDSQMEGLYAHLSENKHTIHRLQEKGTQTALDSIAALEEDCGRTEKQLLAKCKAYGDFTRNLTLTWTDVRASLSDRDIAIEFMEVPLGRNLTVCCAMTLKKGYPSPRFFKLFDLADLHALQDRYARRTDPHGLFYSDPGLYDLVWKPLGKELEGAENVFFAPAGDLYQLAVEYAAAGEGTMADRYRMYRLSSTREVVMHRCGEAAPHSSAVFGGFKYGGDGSGRNEVEDLPGTLLEARSVAECLKKNHISTSLTTAENGTEAAFKALSGQGCDIIHIATHGFCSSTQQDAEKLDDEASLRSSGLLFSGANEALKNDGTAGGKGGDGILSAKEIAMMDLRGTSLVVMSACQTGLGKISGEGVFGLQRGFKKAGARSILMSLWEVDDEATRLLMTTFYKHLASGKGMAVSLNLAREKVRSTKKYASAQYWAAFILLDAIEHER